MILLNFSHPLTPDQAEQIEQLTGQKLQQVIPLPVMFDNEQSFILQLQTLSEQVPLSSEELQTLPILVNPPSLNVIAVLVMAELHGLMGYFPPVVRLSQEKDSLPPRYVVAEILNLQSVRDAARSRR